MTRQEYSKDKSAKIAAQKHVIDLVQPQCSLPSMFREEISVYEITKDSLWRDPRGGNVAFGGVWDSNTREYINKAVMLNPTFTQLVATGAGVTACGEPEIEKHKSVFELILPSGKIRKIPYTSRVVGRISFKRLTPSGTPETKFYSTEVDVDALLNEAIVSELEKIGTTDKYKKDGGKPLVYTEENIKFSTGNEYKDSLQKFDKLNELAKHAYQKVDTKLRSHGAEKFIGIPNITEPMIGGFIYVSRISYNTDDPKIAQALAIGAVQDILGVRAPKQLVDNTTQDLAETSSDAETMPNVTEEPLDDDTETVTADDTPTTLATQAAEGSVDDSVIKIQEWIDSGLIKDESIMTFISAIAKKNPDQKIKSLALAGIVLLSKGAEQKIPAYTNFLGSARAIYEGNASVIEYIKTIEKTFDVSKANVVLVKAATKLLS